MIIKASEAKKNAEKYNSESIKKAIEDVSSIIIRSSKEGKRSIIYVAFHREFGIDRYCNELIKGAQTKTNNFIDTLFENGYKAEHTKNIEIPEHSNEFYPEIKISW